MMDDLIRRQDAIDLIDELETKRLRGQLELMFAPAIRGLMSLPSAQQWIPCSERLPKVGKYVFRTIRKIGWDGEEYRAVDVGLYDTNDGSIIAWMPLPHPWKGEK